MADLCVIHASEDNELASTLVSLLRNYWDVWWDGDIPQGYWAEKVVEAIGHSKGIIALISEIALKKQDFIDEIHHARRKKVPLFPFVIEPVEMPLVLQELIRTEAFNWKGEDDHPGFKILIKKIRDQLGDAVIKRAKSIRISGKEVKLPCFMYSLSSFETQISPKDGLELFSLLKQAQVALISAYDAWNHDKNKIDSLYLAKYRKLKKSECIVILDSGNYESYRKNDRKSKNNPTGWERSKFIEIAQLLSPDAAFGFDNPLPKGDVDAIARRIIAGALSDQKKVRQLGVPIIPILHLPKHKDGVCKIESAPELVIKVAKELDPIMIAIPERELGDGIKERIKTVYNIRISLNKLEKYYPLHLLGAGNILSVIALSAAGADSFDGLEWCRTSGDWETGTLHHFHQFDFFADDYIGRIANPYVRSLIENPKTSFPAKVACMNIEMYNDWMAELQEMIHSGQIERWMQRVLPRKGKKFYSLIHG